jgi:hypothetical protein
LSQRAVRRTRRALGGIVQALDPSIRLFDGGLISFERAFDATVSLLCGHLEILN